MNFASARGFDNSLNGLANRTHNAYQLSFIPHLTAGAAQESLHQITVRVLKYPDAVVRHRADYWAKGDDLPATH